MQTYRAYIIDDNRTFKDFQEFKAVDDGQALREADRLVKANAVELWDNSRLIGVLKPTRRSKLAASLV